MGTIIETPMVYRENVIFKGEVEFHKDIVVQGNITCFNQVTRYVYKDIPIKTRWDLIKMLFSRKSPAPVS